MTFDRLVFERFTQFAHLPAGELDQFVFDDIDPHVAIMQFAKFFLDRLDSAIVRRSITFDALCCLWHNQRRGVGGRGH